MAERPDFWRITVIRPDGYERPDYPMGSTWAMPTWVRELLRFSRWDKEKQRWVFSKSAQRTKHFRSKRKALRIVKVCREIGFIVTIEPFKLTSCGPCQALVLPGRDPVVLPESEWP